jgi:predicted outer membrane repeat protein
VSIRCARSVRAAVVTGVVLGLGLGPAAGLAIAAQADGVTVTNCTEAALRQAVADAPDGGTVAIACDEPIVLTPEGGGTIVVDKTLTLSGAGAAATVDGGQRTSLFVVQAGAHVASPDDLPTLTLRDLTLTGGWSQDQGYPGGGAVWSLANLVAERVQFVDNRAFNRGGAILAEGFGRLTVVDSTFTGNQVTCPFDGSGGGAIAVRQRQQTTISGSTFTGNTATGAASGGAVLAYVSAIRSGFPREPLPEPVAPSPFSAPLVITDSDFTGNSVAPGLSGTNWMYGGGAVASFDHPLTVSTTLFEDNRVNPPEVGFGGAILAASIRDTPTTLTTVDVVGNGFPDERNGVATNGIGGGVALQGTPATIQDTIIEGNRALVGGGLYTRGGPVELLDSWVDANVAGAAVPGDDTFGGGLATHGPLTVTRSSLLGNSGGTCRILWEGDSAPTGDVITDGGGNDVEGAGSCFRPAVPAAPPAPTGALAAPTARATPGESITVTGAGFAPAARVTLVGYLLTAGTAAPGTAAAAPAPVDLGAGQADDTGSFTGTPVLPSSGVWRVVALGAAPDGSTTVLETVLVAAAAGVDVAPVVTSHPSPVTAPAGSTVTLTASAAGSPVPAGQWQSSADGGTGWTDIPGATSGTLTTVAAPGTAHVRAVFANVAGTAASAPATVTGTVPAGPPPTDGDPVVVVGTEVAPVAPVALVALVAPVAIVRESPSGEVLARTGVDVLPLVASGLGLLALGAAVTWIARRRPAA